MADLDRLIDQGLNLYGSGDLDGALAKWEEVLAVDPENPQASSYVDYVRSNYEVLSAEGTGAGALVSDSVPFGIVDEPEYVIEVVPGGETDDAAMREELEVREALRRRMKRETDDPPPLLELDAEEPPASAFDEVTYGGETKVRKRDTGFVQPISSPEESSRVRAAAAATADDRMTRDMPTSPRMPALRLSSEERALAQLAMSDTKTEDLLVEATAQQVSIANALSLPPPGKESSFSTQPGLPPPPAPAPVPQKRSVVIAQSPAPASAPTQAPVEQILDMARTTTIPDATWRAHHGESDRLAALEQHPTPAGAGLRPPAPVQIPAKSPSGPVAVPQPVVVEKSPSGSRSSAERKLAPLIEKLGERLADKSAERTVPAAGTQPPATAPVQAVPPVVSKSQTLPAKAPPPPHRPPSAPPPMKSAAPASPVPAAPSQGARTNVFDDLELSQRPATAPATSTGAPGAGAGEPLVRMQTLDLGLRPAGAPATGAPATNAPAPTPESIDDVELSPAGPATTSSSPELGGDRSEIPTRDLGTRPPGSRRPPSTYPDEDETTTQSDARRIRSEAAERVLAAADDEADELDLDRDPARDSQGLTIEAIPVRRAGDNPVQLRASQLSLREDTRERDSRALFGERDSRASDSRMHGERDSESDLLDLRTHPHIVLPVDPIATRGAEIMLDIDAGAPPHESKDDRTRRRITDLLARAADWVTRRELEKAIIAVDLALSEDPTSALAQKLIHRNRDAILAAFQAYLGDLERQPQLAKPLHLLATTPINPRTAFLLSRVDGMLSIDEILDVSGMPRLEAYQHLCQLFLRGILR